MTRTVTQAGYAVIGGAMMVMQIAGLLSLRRPTLSAVARLVTRTNVGRAVLLSSWLWVGWHLFVRAHHSG